MLAGLAGNANAIDFTESVKEVRAVFFETLYRDWILSARLVGLTSGGTS
jgi:hypothetical protein